MQLSQVVQELIIMIISIKYRKWVVNMSNNIWNNPLMWQTKKTGSDSGDEFDFDFDINSDTGFDADFEEVQDGYQAFKQESSLADAAAKAGAGRQSVQ